MDQEKKEFIKKKLSLVPELPWFLSNERQRWCHHLCRKGKNLHRRVSSYFYENGYG